MKAADASIDTEDKKEMKREMEMEQLWDIEYNRLLDEDDMYVKQHIHDEEFSAMRERFDRWLKKRTKKREKKEAKKLTKREKKKKADD